MAIVVIKSKVTVARTANNCLGSRSYNSVFNNNLASPCCNNVIQQ
jgi:hypothetical protein